MKLIILRGVPGVGKTEIAQRLGKKLKNSGIIFVDEFKKKSFAKDSNLENSKIYAYEQTINRLKKLNFNYLILEETVSEEVFFKMLRDFINKNKLETFWFRIKRKLKYLLEVESKRERVIKNSKQDFDKIKKDIDSLKVKGEKIIYNDDLDLSVREILGLVG